MLGLYVVLHFAFVAALVSRVSCLSDNDRNAMKQTIDPVVKECLEQCGLKDIMVEKDNKKDLHPCIKKCCTKALKVIDDKGQLDRNVLHEMFKKYIENKAESVYRQTLYEQCFDEANSSVTEDSEAEMKRIDILLYCLNILMK